MTVAPGNDGSTTLGLLLTERAASDPDATFMVWQGQEYSRRWLHRRATAYAITLKERGLEPGDRVALLLANGPEFVIAFFGNALAGLVSVPLNVLLKGPELRYQIDKTEAAFLIYDHRFGAQVGALRTCPSVKGFVSVGGKPPFRDRLFPSLLWGEGDPGRGPAPEDVAAILFTSGTTGHPKGAMLTHANYLANAAQLGEFTKMGPGDRPLCVLPLFHVNGQVVTLITPLYTEASMALLPGFSKETFLASVAEVKATSFSAVPTIYAVLLAQPDAGAHDLSSLKYCICGAAPMPVEVFTRFQEVFKTSIVEGYGLTEGTCASVVNPIDGPRKVGTIGVPLPGQEVRVVGNDGSEVPTGEIGEIAIRGANVMKGYFRDETATAAAVVDGWLHTGDLATRDDDGYLTIVGRKKEMIIRGGENIYPKEIEEVAYRQPGILEAAAVGIPHDVWGEEVALFVVAAEGADLSPEAVDAHLKAHLADFKCPREIAFRDALPKTATGKIRKGELRDSFSSD